MGNRLDDAGIRRYLLGLLPEEDAEALEESYLGDPEAWERVRGVEDDLCDDYAADQLSAAEKDAFEGLYLASPARRGRVFAARALRREAAGRTRRRARALDWVRSPRTAPVAVAAGLLMALLALWQWLPRPADTGRPPDRAASGPELATEPSPPEPPAPSAAPTAPPREAAATPVVLALSPVLLRGQERGVELRVPEGADTVRLEMHGDPAVVPARSGLAAAVLTVEGATVWSGRARPAADSHRPSLLALASLPAAALPPGDYLVTLAATGGGEGTLYRYYFRVVP